MFRARLARWLAIMYLVVLTVTVLRHYLHLTHGPPDSRYDQLTSLHITLGVSLLFLQIKTVRILCLMRGERLDTGVRHNSKNSAGLA